MNNKMKWVLLGAAALILGAYLVFQNRDGRNMDAETIKIGALFDLTAEAADWGEDESRAARLAIDQVNAAGGIDGKQVELIIEDAPALDIKRAVSGFNKLVDVDNVLAVIGPIWDVTGAAIAPLADQKKIPIIAPDVSLGVERDLSYDFLFSMWYPQNIETRRLFEYVASQGVKRVSILRNIDSYSQITFDLVKGAAENENIELVNDLRVIDPTAKDFRAEIAKLKHDNVDAVFIIFTDVATKCPAVKQLKESGFTGLLLSDSSTDSVECKDSIEDVIYAFPKSTEAGEKLVADFVTAYGSKPKTPAVPNAYDATNLLMHVIDEGNTTSESIQQALAQTKNYSGVLSLSISFNKKGQLLLPLQDFVIKTIRGGVPTVIE